MRCAPTLFVVLTFACRAEPGVAPLELVTGTGGTVAAPLPSSDTSDDDDPRASSDGGTGTGTASGTVATGGSTAKASETPSANAGATGDAGRNGDVADAPVIVCDAQTVTLDEIVAGEVRTNVKVSVTAVATSQKFLLSHARSGSCLFGAFAGIEPDADGPRGLLVVSYGVDAPENQPCAPGHDALPDDLAPGDAVTATGYFSTYAPSTCSNVVPSPQLMVGVECPLVRSGRQMLPAPFDLTPARATSIARGTDAALGRRFAGGLVRLTNLTALPAEDGTGSVGAYGVVRFAETKLELHNDLEYGDLGGAGPGDSQKSLAYGYPAAFASVTGLLYLDYCTWSLTPRSRCRDLDPPSAGCP